MAHSIEQILDVLVQASNSNSINIRLSDKRKVYRLAGLKLNHTQFNLGIELISKYRVGLTQHGVDVAQFLASPWSSRTIKNVIHMKIYFDQKKLLVNLLTNEFSHKQTLTFLVAELSGSFDKAANICSFDLHENNLVQVVTTIKKIVADTELDIDPDLVQWYDKIIEAKNSKLNVPVLSKINEQFRLLNAHPSAVEWFNTNVSDATNTIQALRTARQLSIPIDTEITNDLKFNSPLSTTIATSNASIININSNTSKYHLSDMIDSICELKHLPVLVIVNDTSGVYELVKSVTSHFVSNGVPSDKINVFFRLVADNPEALAFNSYIKDNGFNNRIDDTTQVVIIENGRLPKPIVRSNFKHFSAVILTAHDFGRVYQYAARAHMLYSYRNSIVNSSTILIKTKGTVVENL